MAKKEIRERVDKLTIRKTLRAVNWWPRFWAWFIDVVVISAMVMAFFPPGMVRSDAFGLSMGTLAVLAYWTILDSGGRRSIGRKVLHIKLVGRDGKNVDAGTAFVSALGKSILLPFDFLIGILAGPGQKQRLFNIATETIVVKVK